MIGIAVEGDLAQNEKLNGDGIEDTPTGSVDVVVVNITVMPLAQTYALKIFWGKKSA